MSEDESESDESESDESESDESESGVGGLMILVRTGTVTLLAVLVAWPPDFAIWKMFS